MAELFSFLLILFAAGLVLLAWLFRPPLRRLWLAASLVTFACILADAAMLIALPYLNLSFAPVGRPLALLGSIRMLILLLTLPILLAVRHHLRRALLLVLSLVLIQGGMLVALFQGMYIEPFRLTVTSFHQPAPAFLPDRPLRILQISDLHVERITRREGLMLEKIDALQPDLIVLTGDYLNVDYLADPQAQQDARQVISQLDAPFGVYAVSGNTDPPEVMAAVFDSLENIRVLDNEVASISLPGGILYLVGVSINGDINIDRDMLTSLVAEYPADAYFILLYHMPDLIETASAIEIPLYLTGHIHGGQVRLPFYGAIITLSDYGKQYEMGRYQVGPTTLFVSRGLGMEGLGMPRVRFLCPPEIVLIELGE